MQAGIVYGYVGQVEGIVNRIKAQSKEEPTVIATGGIAIDCSESTVIDDRRFPNIKRIALNISNET